MQVAVIGLSRESLPSETTAPERIRERQPLGIDHRRLGPGTGELRQTGHVARVAGAVMEDKDQRRGRRRGLIPWIDQGSALDPVHRQRQHHALGRSRTGHRAEQEHRQSGRHVERSTSSHGSLLPHPSISSQGGLFGAPALLQSQGACHDTAYRAPYCFSEVIVPSNTRVNCFWADWVAQWITPLPVAPRNRPRPPVIVNAKSAVASLPVCEVTRPE
jgi:hypothetical protein